MRRALPLAGALLAVTAAAFADERFKDVVVTSSPVSGPIHMLLGSGGNIAASIGEDGTLIVDDQFAPLAGRIQAALEQIGGAAPRVIINTHFHGDHTGSNAEFGRNGTIIAHDNVRARLVAEDMPRAGLPLVTFDGRMSVHFNGDLIELLHLPEGHTDGDSVVWFKGAGVVHLGDHFFNGFYPFVDVASGGSIEGYLRNQSTVMDRVPADVKIIPGHGPIATVEDLARTQNVIRHSYALVREQLEKGVSTQDIAAELDAKYPTWGAGFISAARWIEIIQSNLD